MPTYISTGLIKLFQKNNPFILLIGILFFFSPATSSINAASEPDDKEDQVRQIETDLSRQKEQYKQFDLKEKGLLEQLSSIDQAIIGKRRLIRALREKINYNKSELRKKQRALSQIERSIFDLEELLSKRLVALYKYSKRGYLQTLATANDLDQLNKRMKYLEMVLRDDQRVMKQLDDERANHRRALSQIQAQLGEIEKMEEIERKRLASIKQDLEAKVIILAKIHQEKEFHKTAVDELEYASRNLKNTLLKLNGNKEKELPLPAGFQKLKGQLPLPYDGEILKDIKNLGIDTVNTHKGIYISGPLGSDIKAIFTGRVDFSGQLKGYGDVIVINHGARFYTISAYLSQRDKEKGDMVSSGEVIGQMGRTALMTGPGLYFEIRKGGKSLDPLKWLEVH